MKLQTLLKQNINELSPQALILVKRFTGRLSVQRIYYQPQVLNLGVVLLGYYTEPSRVRQLSQLGDCLSIGHYLRSPRTLEYGRDFSNDPRFQKLPGKLQKHLTGEIQDCDVALARDLNVQQPTLKAVRPAQAIERCPSAQDVYLYQNKHWLILRTDGKTLKAPVSLRNQVRSLLKKA